jgi:hypothetical protein
MGRKSALLAVAFALFGGGCTSTVIRDAANSQCYRRVESDRARCLRNNRSSDTALAGRNAAEREAEQAWEARTLQGIQALASHH